MLRKSSVIIGVAALALSFAAGAQDEIPGPKVGDKFPHDLAAPDQYGKAQSIDTLMGEKGLAVFFVRSADWCPYCQRQLGDVNDRLAEFKALGLNVVSVSVDQIEHTAAFTKEHNVMYPMLADPAGDINLELGVRDEQYPVGSKAFGVPRPIVYIIDTSKTIRARYMEPTYRTRPDLNVVLADAAKLGL
jgi:peroxiredoxin